MARTVILEFDDGDESDAEALVHSINEYNLPITVDRSDDTCLKVRPYVSGMYSKIYTIEGKSVD